MQMQSSNESWAQRCHGSLSHTSRFRRKKWSPPASLNPLVLLSFPSPSAAWQMDCIIISLPWWIATKRCDTWSNRTHPTIASLVSPPPRRTAWKEHPRLKMLCSWSRVMLNSSMLRRQACDGPDTMKANPSRHCNQLDDFPNCNNSSFMS